jgi:hypothetical protein
MIMQTRTKYVMVTAALGIAGIGVGATMASAASGGSNSPAVQPGGNYVFACVNHSGKIDYLEFRKPLPHQCWFPGETMWYWAVQPVSHFVSYLMALGNGKHLGTPGEPPAAEKRRARSRRTRRAPRISAPSLH